MERVVAQLRMIREEAARRGVGRIVASPETPELKWTEVNDAGNTGVVARCRGGCFKVLKVSPAASWLFYEKDGGFTFVAVGDTDELKEMASNINNPGRNHRGP